jgi:hypothetical protein
MDYRKESDARIVIDDLPRKAGWDPADKSMVETKVLVNWPAGRECDSVDSQFYERTALSKNKAAMMGPAV